MSTENYHMHIADPAQMEALGATLAHAADHAGRVLLFLEGDLGAGKTTLARGFLRALGHAGSVKSPTYTLLEPYELAGRMVYHLDLYRLGHPEELEYLGLRDFLSANTLWLVEWPERGAGILPAVDVRVQIRHAGSAREVVVDGCSPVGRQVVAGITSREK